MASAPTTPTPALHLAYDDAGNAILATNPFALLVGMQLDQQIPIETAFSGPGVLTERLGELLTPGLIVGLDAETVERACATPPAVHRFPRAAAQRLRALATAVADTYDGDTAAIWTHAATGDDLVRRLAALPGFGPQKARIFTALLGKQFGVTPRGWKKAAGDYGLVGHRSVADVVDEASLQKVRAHKKSVKAAAKAAAAG